MSKVSRQNKDTISKLKKDEEKAKPTEIIQNDDDYQGGSEDEEQQKTAGLIKEQAIQSSDKPKGLKDLFGGNNEKTTVTKKTTQKTHQKKQPEEKATRFYNSKGVQPKKLDKIVPPPEQKRDEPEKKVYNTKGLDEVAQQNKNVKAPKKNYLEKDIKKEYKDETENLNIAKPEFKNLKIGNENFVELNHQEDLLAKNLAQKNFEFKKDYTTDDKEKGEKKKNFKHHHKYQKKEEPVQNDVDSDGFEVVGTKEKKKESMPKKPRQYNQYHKKRYHKNNEGGQWKKDEKKEGDAQEGEAQPDEQNQQEKGEEKKPEETKTEEQKSSAQVTVKIDTKGAKSLKDMFG